MLHKIMVLAHFYLKMNLREKTVFIYTLGFPTAYFMISQSKLIFAQTHQSSTDIINLLFEFWAYILICSILNGVTDAMVSGRENNLLKTFTYLTGNKKIFFFAHLITQLVLTLGEILLFTLAAMLLMHSFNFIILLISIFYTSIGVFTLGIFANLLLLFHIKVQTYNVLANGTIFAALLLSAVHPGAHFLHFLIDFFPLNYATDILNVILMSFHQENVDPFVLLTVLIVTISYLSIGFLSLNHASIATNTSKY
ncbi:Hypothetical protein ADU73_1183 [Pediococcus damnosus]|uniref:hypothetical protein n=1 Tax=Pediococcus damnosus TaxID=51663 RepID=UPI00078DBC3B|nr:hypothetical protein [Pediococcus damnosus]AMV69581.1 Hypothetical protein ADU73_1183 [Pediococcus damnosus]